MLTGPITLSELREHFKVLENEGLTRMFEEHVDENVEWTITSPADGPLGKTVPNAGQ